MGKANEEEEKRKKEGEEGTRVGWVKGKKMWGEEKKTTLPGLEPGIP